MNLDMRDTVEAQSSLGIGALCLSLSLYKAGGFKLMALSSLTPFDIEATKNNNNKLVILGKTLWMKQNPAKFALISAQNKQTNTQMRDRDPDSEVSVAVCICICKCICNSRLPQPLCLAVFLVVAELISH